MFNDRDFFFNLIPLYSKQKHFVIWRPNVRPSVRPAKYVFNHETWYEYHATKKSIQLLNVLIPVVNNTNMVSVQNSEMGATLAPTRILTY